MGFFKVVFFLLCNVCVNVEPRVPVLMLQWAGLYLTPVGHVQHYVFTHADPLCCLLQH